jgi:hypothetical protein
MNLVELLDEKKIEIPEIVSKEFTKLEMERKIKDLNIDIIYQIEDKLRQLRNQKEISITQYDEFRKDLYVTSFLDYEEVIKDEEKYHEYREQVMALHMKFFKLHEKKLSFGHVDYLAKYIGNSELYQFFHEDPDDRKERLEGPIDKELEELDEKIDELEKKQQETYLCKINSDKKSIQRKIAEFFDSIFTLVGKKTLGL